MLPLCALAGALNALAFAPFGWWPLQILLLAGLFHVASRASSARQGAVLGWAYGFGWTACGVYWLYISMHRYGDMPAWMAALAVALLALALGGFAALGVGGARWLQQRASASPAVTLLVIFPAAWALLEWMRGWIFTGFPWVVSGYAHTASPLAGFAPLVGVYGMGWLAALAAGCIAVLPSRKLPLAGLLAIFGIGLALQSLHWTAPHGQPISVRLLQGNVPQEMKFDSEHVIDTLVMYDTLIEQAPADLIVTPETALPLFLHQLPSDYLPHLAHYAHQSNSYLALGIPVASQPSRYANSMIGIAPQATDKTHPYQYRYDKHHLVPFGEFIPFGFRWFVNLMHIPLGDFTGAAILQPPFPVKDQWVMPNICYEDLFGEEIAAQLRHARATGAPQPSVLLNLSNIAWFGDSIALPQHLQISQMRALETGRPMLRATNTGVTAVIDAQGKISAQLPPFQRGVLSASVQGYQGTTPYVLYGNTVIVGILVLFLIGAWFPSRKTR